ncbi:unnamed protein product, partial [Ixodes persulcatus]
WDVCIPSCCHTAFSLSTFFRRVVPCMVQRWLHVFYIWHWTHAHTYTRSCGSSQPRSHEHAFLRTRSNPSLPLGSLPVHTLRARVVSSVCLQLPFSESTSVECH